MPANASPNSSRLFFPWTGIGALAGALTLLSSGGSEHPWLVLAVAATVGVVSGLLGYSTAVWIVRQNGEALERGMGNLYRQVESLAAVHSVIKFSAPPPAFRGWPVSPDLAAIAITQLLLASQESESEDFVVCECGSGASTIVLGTLLKSLGRGRLVAMESDRAWCEETRSNVRLHDLTDRVDVVFAPLVDHEIGGSRFRWYGQDDVRIRSKIQFLLVDGPRWDVGSLARFPAVPVLRNQMAPGCRILLDDTKRTDEREVVRRWTELGYVGEVQEFDAEKGAMVMRLLPKKA